MEQQNVWLTISFNFFLNDLQFQGNLFCAYEVHLAQSICERVALLLPTAWLLFAVNSLLGSKK